MKYFIIAVIVLLVIVVIIFIIGAILPEKHTATVSAKISATKEKVWSLISYPEGFPSWRENVENVEILSKPGEPLKWKEMYKRNDSLAFEEISRVDQEVFISKIAGENLPFGGTWTIKLQQEGDSIVVSIVEDGEIYNLVFRVFARFIFGYDSTMKEYLAHLERAV